VAADPWPATDIVGTSLDGDVVSVSLESERGRLLLAFLAIRCDGCQIFWDGIRAVGDLGLPADVSVIAVTKGPGSVSSDELAILSDGVEPGRLVMSDQAWVDYRVSGYPLFVLVDAASRTVVGETVGLGWADVVAMVAGDVRPDRPSSGSS
jgi:hypothetical protein